MSGYILFAVGHETKEQEYLQYNIFYIFGISPKDGLFYTQHDPVWEKKILPI
jgi:hypothetical protein